MVNSKDIGLTRAKQFMEEGKLEEALRLLNEFGDKKNTSFYNQISYYILRSSLYLYFFQLTEHLNYAEKAYQNSQDLEKSLQLLDVYIQMAMALSYWYKSEESFGFIVRAEKLLKFLTGVPSAELMERKASIFHLKGWFYIDHGETEKALKFARKSLEIREELNFKADIGISLWQIAWVYFTEENDLALKYVDQCLIHCEKITYKKLIQRCTWLKGFIYLIKGELDQAIGFIEHCKTLFEELPKEMKDERGFAQLLHLIGSIYLEKNDLDKAKENLEKALKIKTEIGSNPMKMVTLDSLIPLALTQNDLKKARDYLKDMKRISDQEENEFLNSIYHLNKAIILKLSPLVSDRVKAEEIFKELLEKKMIDYGVKVKCLLNLCDLFLVKIEKTKDLKLLDEIKLYIIQILDIAKNQKSYSLLAETYLLQAKLELSMLKLKEAQQFLKKAHDVAENYGLNQLSKRIITEQHELSNNIIKWEKFKASGEKISEHMDLVHIKKQIEIMLQKRIYLKILDQNAN